MAKKAKRSAPKVKTATVRLRFANPGASMAAKKKGGHKGSRKSPRRSNPGKKKGSGRRRRKNPETFMGALGSFAAAALVGLAAGTAVLYGQQKISPGSNLSLYGVPAVGFLAGAALAKKAPTIGAGLALGSVLGPFTLPLATKVFGSGSASTTPAQAARLAAVEMGALGAVEMGDAYADEWGYDVSSVQRQYS